MAGPADNNRLDDYTIKLLDELDGSPDRAEKPTEELLAEVKRLYETAADRDLTGPIVDLFTRLLELKRERHLRPDSFGLNRDRLTDLAIRHQQIDEHQVTVGGRVGQALAIVKAANLRVDDYLERNRIEAPSGIELWDQIQENIRRIMTALGMTADEWSTYQGQLGRRIDDAPSLARILDLPPEVVTTITRVTRQYRMRLTPYYASLIQPGRLDDPVLLQSVPSAEMVDNVGLEIPPVAADHSPARLIDQFYPRTLTIKATNMCAMYCTHCLRIAHIGRKDSIYSLEAYREALDYIRANQRVRDVLITGGDAFVLPNRILGDLLGRLDEIEHVRLKRLGTRTPVTVPQRIDNELLDILAESNDRQPVRVVTQINTPQEITPLSREAFRRLSRSVSAVLNQAVLLKGINDSKVKMWKLCETIQESYVRPYYVFNCSYRNPQFAHLRVPVEVGRDIVESMYGNISGDAIPRYIATAGGKIPLHRSNVAGRKDQALLLIKPWSGEQVAYPDADPKTYARRDFAFTQNDG